MNWPPFRYVVLGFSWILIAAIWFFVVFSGGPDDKTGAIADEWSDLFARCRVAVETAGPLDTQGMAQVPLPDEMYLSAAQWRARAWQKPGDRLTIVEREIGPVDAVVRSCEVQLADTKTTFTRRAQADIVFAYLNLRTRLTGGETHELRDMQGLYPMFGLGFGPLGPNSNGCNVLSFVYVSPEQGTIVAKTGEVAPPSCAGSSYVPDL